MIIYCILYYVYLYILTDSMSTKMYMEGKINYNYNYNVSTKSGNHQEAVFPTHLATKVCIYIKIFKNKCHYTLLSDYSG